MLTFTPGDSQGFWDAVRADYWEKQPGAFRFEPGAAPLALDSVFQAVTHMPERGSSDRFWAARGNDPQDYDDFVRLDLDLVGPQVNDGGFDAFFRRMTAHAFGINIHRIGAAVPAFAELVHSFARELSNVPGAAPAQSWLADTFFGNYRATPFGIHRDPASVFSFVLQGQRTYCFWPMATFAPDDPGLWRPDSQEIRRRMPTAEIFQAGPGDLVYWPSNRWHVVLSDGEPFVAAQVSAYFLAEDVGQAPLQ